MNIIFIIEQVTKSIWLIKLNEIKNQQNYNI